MSRRTEIMIFSVFSIIYVSTFVLLGTGCIDAIPFPITRKPDIIVIMNYDQWKESIESGKAIVKSKETGESLAVEYQGIYNDKRYKLSNGKGGFSLYHFWYYDFEILDPKDGKFKKLGKGDWEIKVYTHKDINGNIVKEYSK